MDGLVPYIYIYIYNTLEMLVKIVTLISTQIYLRDGIFESEAVENHLTE